MKYQYILNNEIVFETNDASEYFKYLISENNTQQRNSVLYNLLMKSGGYICNMYSASKRN